LRFGSSGVKQAVLQHNFSLEKVWRQSRRSKSGVGGGAETLI